MNCYVTDCPEPPAADVAFTEFAPPCPDGDPCPGHPFCTQHADKHSKLDQLVAWVRPFVNTEDPRPANGDQ